MAKDTTVRFAFGTVENPGSSVWRVNVRSKTGDIYINNAPQMGNEVHISLHRSGIFSVKLSKVRHNLLPPWTPKDSLLTLGPCIFFDTQFRSLPPLPATGSIEKIHWLGWPRFNGLFTVYTYYCKPTVKINVKDNERIICGPIDTKLFYEDYHFYMVVSERQRSISELATGLEKWKNLEFNKIIPNAMEFIKIAKTPDGPSAIVIEGFNHTKIN